MHLFKVSLLGLNVVSAANGYTTEFDASTYAKADVVNVDVAIIGGGATGTYAAITLRDLGKSRYENTSVATKYFDRLGVTYNGSPMPSYTNATVYSDFTTGKPLTNFTPSFNFWPYITQLERYPFLERTKDLAALVDPDLYSSFGDFLVKYWLQDVAYSIYMFSSTAILQLPTLNVISNVGLKELGVHTTAIGVVSEKGNHIIYINALKVLQKSVLLRSTVTSARRNSYGSQLVVSTPTGKKLINTKQLSYYHSTHCREPGSISEGLWPGIVKISGLPAGVTYKNAAPETLYNLPTAPAINSLTPTAIEGFYRFYMFNAEPMPYAQARAKTLASIKAFADAVTGVSTEPELIEFASHTPWYSKFPSEAIKNGTWHELYELQGYRNTWYAGMEIVLGSVALWNYTSTLIPEIVAKL
ncbi:hypothetical protein V491_04691 [Pseudogymnoascus sp. VKM F-3775]|nr:hypothetical protein V491_04691 [Pseudogymnoascus sp. VKM F-3775]